VGGGTEEGEGAAARKEGGEGGGTGAGADDRRRDAVREAKKGIFQRGASIPPLRPHATARRGVFFAGRARGGSAPAGAGPIRMGWGFCVCGLRRVPWLLRRAGRGAAVQCGGMDGRAGRFGRFQRGPLFQFRVRLSRVVDSSPLPDPCLSLCRSPDVAGGGPREATVLSGASRQRGCGGVTRPRGEMRPLYG